ncbi:MAG TPA: GIY-YIG nuclease family protein [Terriglobales bacterium]|nr:GIY-YIG nuclease family protein [Terriglobales bacterium]
MAQRERRYYVYILTNPSRRPLYTGVTNNIFRRSLEHKEKDDEGYTSHYNLNRLVYYQTFRYVGNAIQREKQIKSWGRAKKDALINAFNPKWDDLAREWGRSFLKDKEKT